MTMRCLAVTLACAASALVAAAEDVAFNEAQEQMLLFNANAAKRCLADLKANPKFDYATWAPKVEALIANEGAVRKALDAYLDMKRDRLDAATFADAGKEAKLDKAAAIALVEDYRKAMLQNPILDFGKILCVHRKINNPRGAFGGRGAGMTGLNAENHMVAPRTGFENEIVVLSDFRGGAPKTKVLYKPADKTSIVRDLDLDFDASRILFTSPTGTNNLFGIYEIPAEGIMADPMTVAAGRKPALVSPYDIRNDIQWWDASYLPNRDQVIMLGTAAYQFLPCEDGNMPMAVIYRVDRKTGEVRQLTYEQDSDYTPSITHDGRILYTRWEYSDQPHYWSRVLTTMNPDGIGQLSVWGSNSHVPTFFYYARCVPGSNHLITMIGGGHHDRAEVGRFLMLDPTLARAYPTVYDPPDRDWGPPRHTLRIPFKTFPKEKTGMVHEFPGFGQDVEGDMADPYTMNQFARNKPFFSHPWPLSENYHLAVVKTSASTGHMGLYLVDRFDNITRIAVAQDGLYCDPIPFVARKRPPVIPDRSDLRKKTCSVHIADIYNGPGLRGIPRGTVKKLRLFSYHYNYHKTGGHSSTGWVPDEDGRRGGHNRVESSWDVKRPLGTVDLEEDGSCCFEMPCNTPVSVQPLDEKGCAVQIMRSWIVGMPGERVSCTGCHEDNRSSVHTKQTIADKKYFKGDIQKIKPIDADGVRPWGFANEMYPVVKKYCLACHGDPKKAPCAKADQGGLKEKKSAYYGDGWELSGKRLVMNTPENAYRMLHPYIRRPGPESDEALTEPMEWHASISPLVQMLRKGHHGVKMAPEDCLKIYEWIDLNAPFYGKWNPPAFKGKDANGKVVDRFMNADEEDQVKRRLELQIRYARNYDNPEKEHDDYAAKLATRTITPVMPVKCTRPAPFSTNEAAKIGWPMNDIEACDAQLGTIQQIAPNTSKVLVLGDGQSLVFRRIPAGRFPMGSDTGYPDEAPVRVVEIKKPFWISEMEIQNQQYKCFDPEHDSRFQDEFGKDHVFPGYIGNHRRMPVVRVNWNEARAFCAWLSKKCGVKAELPTEAQWEWAARAGSGTPFPWGGLDDDFSKCANLADRDLRFGVVGFDGGGNIRKRHPYRVDQNYPLHDERWKDDWFMLNFVGRANANRWGLYDMHGNAAEWTLSDYVPYPYDCEKANTLSQKTLKVARGGSYLSRPREATSSVRQAFQPWQKVQDVGFRVVLLDAE